jgi:hypothetical protein
MPSSRHQQEDHNIGDSDNHDGEKKKLRRREYYPSNIQGALIVNANSGQLYPWRVGSLDSMRLYKVVDSRGTCDKDGRPAITHARGTCDKDGRPAITPSRDPNFLFYDSPEEYMRHRDGNLTVEAAREWHALQTRLFPKGGELDMRAYQAHKAWC